MANSTTLFPLPDGRMAVDVTEAKTLAITDCGVVQNVIVDGLTLTLPSTIIAYDFTIRNGGDNASGTPLRSGTDASMDITVSPASADMIVGMEVSGENNKDFVNTKATAEVGDELHLLGDGTAGAGWSCKVVKGVWAKES